jgi:hypothetical protein
LGEVDSVSNDITGMASWDIFGIIFMLISLGDLGVKIKEALVNWVNLDEFVKSIVNKLRDIFSVILMLIVDIGAFFWEIIGVILMVLDIGSFFREVISVIFVVFELNHGVSVEFLMTSVMSRVRLLLGVVSFIVLVMESVVVSIWG